MFTTKVGGSLPAAMATSEPSDRSSLLAVRVAIVIIIVASVMPHLMHRKCTDKYQGKMIGSVCSRGPRIVQ